MVKYLEHRRELFPSSNASWALDTRFLPKTKGLNRWNGYQRNELHEFLNNYHSCKAKITG